MLPADLTGLDEFLLKADGIFGIDRIPAVSFLDLARFGFGRNKADMAGIRRSHVQLGLVQNVAERFDIPRAVARGVGVGDVSGNRRLASSEPLGLSRCQIEQIDRCRHRGSPGEDGKEAFNPSILPEADLPP